MQRQYDVSRRRKRVIWAAWVRLVSVSQLDALEVRMVTSGVEKCYSLRGGAVALRAPSCVLVKA